MQLKKLVLAGMNAIVLIMVTLLTIFSVLLIGSVIFVLYQGEVFPIDNNFSRVLGTVMFLPLISVIVDYCGCVREWRRKKI